LNGGLAPDTKASGHVGANADATGSRPSTSSSTNSMSLASENTSDEQVDDEDALLNKIKCKLAASKFRHQECQSFATRATTALSHKS
jgi:hypothetical protein